MDVVEVFCSWQKDHVRVTHFRPGPLVYYWQRLGNFILRQAPTYFFNSGNTRPRTKEGMTGPEVAEVEEGAVVVASSVVRCWFRWPPQLLTR